MEIANHRLKDSGVKFRDSPNHGGIFAAGLPDSIVIHYTAGSSAASSVETLCRPESKASAHLVVGRDDSVTQLVPFNTIAWHAGASSYQGRSGFNNFSIGIEIDNAGSLTKSGDEFVAWFGRSFPASEVVEAVHRNESTPGFWLRYTEGQIATVSAICEALIAAYPITMILGHEEIAPGRKRDPGPAFPLDKLRDRLLVRDRAETEAFEPTSKVPMGMVNTSLLNVRAGPDANSSTVMPPLGLGTLVTVLQEQSGWYEVEIKNRGWVKKEFLKTA